VIVIGGGLAGLAAGVALAESGWRVRLFEQRPYLGGRATSYFSRAESTWTIASMSRSPAAPILPISTAASAPRNKVRFFDRLFFLDPQGRSGAMQPEFFRRPFT